MSAESPVKREIVATTLRAVGLLTAFAFVALVAYGLIARSPDTTIDDALAQAQEVAAPGFDLEVLARGRQPAGLSSIVARAATDGRVALSELRGTPVVVNFWASWCVPCRVEAPVLERGWSARDQDVLFLGLNMQDVREDALEFLQRLDVSYLNVRESGKATARRYGATGLPETYFISARGQVVFRVIGAISAEQLQQGMTAVRAGRPAGSSQGGDRRSTR